MLAIKRIKNCLSFLTLFFWLSSLGSISAWADDVLNITKAPPAHLSNGDSFTIEGSASTFNSMDTNISYFFSKNGQQIGGEREIKHYISTGEKEPFREKITINESDFKKSNGAFYENGTFELTVKANSAIKTFPIALNFKLPKVDESKEFLQSIKAKEKAKSKENKGIPTDKVKNGEIAPIVGVSDVALRIIDGSKKNASIFGALTNSNGDCLEKVKFELSTKDKTKETYTDTFGNYMFSDVLPGHYQMYIIIDGHKTALKEIDVMPNVQEKELNFVVDVKNNVQLAPTDAPKPANIPVSNQKTYELCAFGTLILAMTIFGLYFFYLPWKENRSGFTSSNPKS